MSYYQQIYNRLRQDGLSEAGALGVLGNWDCESNCEPYRLQGDFSPYRTASKAYVQSLNNGSLSKDQFSNDQKGFGLAQWTYPTRKAEMYDEWKKSSKAIDDPVFQADFAVKEMKRDNADLYSFLCKTNDIYQACSRVCKEFERPAVNNIDARYQAAIRIKNEIALNDWQDDTPTPTPTPEPTPQDVYWPPRTIDSHCSGWPEVGVLQSILYCRGYLDDYEDFAWGDVTTDALKAFQRESGLTADGCCGPMTWRKLLEM